MSAAIVFENISKQYRLGEVGTGTLSHDLHRAWARLRGKPDPFAKVGVVNDRTQAASSEQRAASKTSLLSRLSPLATSRSQSPDIIASGDYVWALKDIDFSVEQGEILGIIGRNGAGKSTLLKLLSRVTAPTTGSIKARGRIASLLEVGTGFHPELTGRENIYLNGAILGMRRHEITKQLEAIVDFSGCAKYIDTPVKRYSSGMTVRLGFAVAAHLDCEILVVDEVLAVGDAEFQKKCIGKMQEVSRGSGKTVLFVSHNMGSVSQLCSECVVLEQGNIVERDQPSTCIRRYLASHADAEVHFEKNPTSPITFVAGRCLKEDGSLSSSFGVNESINLELDLAVREEIPGVEIGLRVESSDGTIVFTTQRSQQIDATLTEDTKKVLIRIPHTFLAPGIYGVTFAAYLHNQQMFDFRERPIGFRVEDTGTAFARYAGQNFGLVLCECDWREIHDVNWHNGSNTN